MPYQKLRKKIKEKPLRVIYAFYWFLLAYIISALVFWFLVLNKQNKELTELLIQDISIHDIRYIQKEKKIEQLKERKSVQYIDEGVTFLLLTLAGAVFVFRFINRQLIQSQQQRNFIMAITHELKTPIAVAKLNLETMQIRKLDFSQQQKLIRNTIQEANRLNSLCNNMLLLGQLDTGGYKFTREKFDLATLANDCVEGFMIRFPERKIEIEVSNEIIITGDKLSLQLAINNLLDNAIKYSPKENVVLVKVFQENKKIKLQVIDEGFGISNAEKGQILEKYFRGAQRQTKGTGLGLYLTKEIVKQHHGEISVENNIPKGCVFEIQFKASKNS